MKKAKKILALLLCAVLLIGATVAGTVAYLTSQDTVTNTFTVGKVEITMDESKVDAYGKKYLKEVKDNEGNTSDTVVNSASDATRVDGNQYKLIPGHEYIKDPTIHVASTSEECYLFVKIEKNDIFTLSGQTDWTNINGTNFWKYKEKVAGGTNVTVFGKFTYDANGTVKEPTNHQSEQIVITAYAIQADGFNSVDEAWSALNTQEKLVNNG